MSHLAEDRCGEGKRMAPAGISHAFHKKKSWKQARRRGAIYVMGEGTTRVACYGPGAAATASPAASYTEKTPDISSKAPQTPVTCACRKRLHSRSKSWHTHILLKQWFSPFPMLQPFDIQFLILW